MGVGGLPFKNIVSGLERFSYGSLLSQVGDTIGQLLAVDVAVTFTETFRPTGVLKGISNSGKVHTYIALFLEQEVQEKPNVLADLSQRSSLVVDGVAARSVSRRVFCWQKQLLPSSSS